MEKYLYQDLYDLEKVHFWHIAKRKAAALFIEKYIKSRHLKILDIGCGTGENLKTLEKFGEAFGIDSSIEAIRFCRKNGLKNVKVASAYQTGYKNETFDLVTMFDLLEHVDDQKALQEVKRILKPGGFVLITVPAHMWLWSKWDQVLHHLRRYERKKLNLLLKNSGFKIIKSSYFYSYLLLPIIVTRFFKGLFFKDYYPSDFKMSNPLINKFGLGLSKIELIFIRTTGIPIGTSIICLAEKK